MIPPGKKLTRLSTVRTFILGHTDSSLHLDTTPSSFAAEALSPSLCNFFLILMFVSVSLMPPLCSVYLFPVHLHIFLIFVTYPVFGYAVIR